MPDSNVVAKLFASRKFVASLFGLTVVGVLAAFRIVSAQQFVEVLKWVVGSFVVGTGIEGIGGPTVPAPPGRGSEP